MARRGIVKFKKNSLALITISIMLCSCLSGCWNSREMNSLGFMTSMGFDKSDKGIMLTVQILNPRAIASQKSVNEPSIIVYTEEGKDTIEMIRRMITRSSRKLNGTHLENIVFGEEFAKEGITEVLDFLSREHQFRTQMYFTVAKGTTANEVLNNLTTLDPNPALKLFSSLKASDQIWAGTHVTELIDLTNSIISDGVDPVLTGVEITDNREDHDSIDMLKKMETDAIKIYGLAVFHNDKFVGWLDEDESKGFNYITGDVPSTMAYVEDKSVGKITIEVTKTKAKQIATLVNDKPYITVDIDVEVNIETVSGDLDITKEENIETIEHLAEEKGLKLCEKTLKKTQKELSVDIFGFGETIHRTYPKLWGSLKENWNSTFRDLPVKINFKVKILKTGTISNSFFMKEK